MDQVATIGLMETRQPFTAHACWDGVAQPGSKQVLLAEDEPSVRNLMQGLLHSWGYRVFPARNGREALEIAEQHQDAWPGAAAMLSQMPLLGFQESSRAAISSCI